MAGAGAVVHFPQYPKTTQAAPVGAVYKYGAGVGGPAAAPGYQNPVSAPSPSPAPSPAGGGGSALSSSIYRASPDLIRSAEGYMNSVFTQQFPADIEANMADRVRTAQAARGFGGGGSAVVQDEARFITGLTEQRRQEVLASFLQNKNINQQGSQFQQSFGLQQRTLDETISAGEAQSKAAQQQFNWMKDYLGQQSKGGTQTSGVPYAGSSYGRSSTMGGGGTGTGSNANGGYATNSYTGGMGYQSTFGVAAARARANDAFQAATARGFGAGGGGSDPAAAAAAQQAAAQQAAAQAKADYDAAVAARAADPGQLVKDPNAPLQLSGNPTYKRVYNTPTPVPPPPPSTPLYVNDYPQGQGPQQSFANPPGYGTASSYFNLENTFYGGNIFG